MGLRVASIKSKEEYRGLESILILSLDALPNHKIILTLGNSRIPDISLSDGSGFHYHVSETLNILMSCYNKYLYIKLFGQYACMHVNTYMYLHVYT